MLIGLVLNSMYLPIVKRDARGSGATLMSGNCIVCIICV